MKYKIFDTQLKDYLEPYNDREYWTLEEAKDLAWRRLDDWEWEEVEALQKLQALKKVERITSEEEITEVLSWFDYELERVEQ